MKKPISGNKAASPETASSSAGTPPHACMGGGSPCEAANPHPGKGSPSQSLSANTTNTANTAVPPRGSVQMVFDQMLGPAPAAPVPEPLMTKADLVKHYRVCERTIERWVAADMPRCYIGKREMRFRLSDVQLWLQENRIDRFAAQGIATTMTEVRRRIVNIPILSGLEIVNSATPKGSTNVAQGNALRPTTATTHALKGQTNTAHLTPRCRPGRKKKARPSPTVPCRGNDHKWRTSRYSRTCAVCGRTEDRDPSDNWISST